MIGKYEIKDAKATWRVSQNMNAIGEFDQLTVKFPETVRVVKSISPVLIAPPICNQIIMAMMVKGI